VRPSPSLLRELSQLILRLFPSEIERARLADDLGVRPHVEDLVLALAEREDRWAMIARRRAPHAEEVWEAAKRCGSTVDLHALLRAQVAGLRDLIHAGRELERRALPARAPTPSQRRAMAALDATIDQALEEQQANPGALYSFGRRIRELLLRRFVARGQALPRRAPRGVWAQIAGHVEYEEVASTAAFGERFQALRVWILIENARCSWEGGRVRRTIPVAEEGPSAELAELLPLWWLGVLAAPGAVDQRVRPSTGVGRPYVRLDQPDGTCLRVHFPSPNLLLLSSGRRATPRAGGAELVAANDGAHMRVEDVIGRLWIAAA
jgi:hypothetical protein